MYTSISVDRDWGEGGDDDITGGRKMWKCYRGSKMQAQLKEAVSTICLDDTFPQLQSF